MGVEPYRTYKSASPVPPLTSIFRLLAFAGTANQWFCPELPAPPMLAIRSGLTVLPPVVLLKMAVTVSVAFRVNAQTPEPLQAPPLQPTKLLPPEGVAERVIVEPIASVSVQMTPQLRAPPARATVPEPEPTFAMCSVACGGCVKVAVTDLAAFKVTVHEDDDPEQAPLQPPKLCPAVGAAVKVTMVLAL